jgi:hypothetical protein
MLSSSVIFAQQEKAKPAPTSFKAPSEVLNKMELQKLMENQKPYEYYDNSVVIEKGELTTAQKEASAAEFSGYNDPSVFFSSSPMKGSKASVTVTIGTGSDITTSTTSTITPFKTYWMDGQDQILFTKAELNAAGLGAGDITALAFNVGGTPNTATLNSFTISAQHTALTALTGFITSGWNQCYIGNVVAVAGWNTFTFNTANFNWNGNDNVVFKVCFDNSGYTSNTHVYYTTTPSTGVHYYEWGDYSTASGCDVTNVDGNAARPNVQITGEAVSTPLITVNPNTLNFGYVPAGTFSTPQTYVLTASNLDPATGTIVVTAPENFQVSEDGSKGWSGGFSITYPPLTVTIWVRYAPTVANTSNSGNVTNVGGGASANVAVSGNTYLYAAYCTSNATSTADEEIFNVTLGTLSNTSDCSTLAPGPGSIQSMYSNYTTSVAAPDLPAGLSTAFSVGIGTCGTGNYSNGIKIFIDFNKNYSFSDPEDLVYTSAVSTVGAHTETGFIAVPGGAALGLTMMRIVNVETSTPGTTIQPCGTYTWGETEDYLVNITAATNPYLSAVPGSINFGSVPTGGTSLEFSYALTGANLTPAAGNITITPPANFEVSTTMGGPYSSTPITTSYSGGVVNTTVYAVFKPVAYGAYAGNIGNSGGSASVNVAVSGMCPSPGNDCTNPYVINIPSALPFSDLGQTTCGRGNNYDATCMGYYDGGEDIIYQLNVASTVTLDITLDPKTSTWTGFSVFDLCPADPAAICLYSKTNTGASVYTLEGAILAAGTYYIMVDTWPSPTCITSFDLTIVEVIPCVVECPAGALQENEADIANEGADVTNGGCNIATPLFTPIAVGDTYCGKINTYTVGTAQTRDTDWYRVDLSATNSLWSLTWTVTAEFNVLIFLVDAGTENCTDYTIISSTTALKCVPAVLTATNLQPKVYYVLVMPNAFTGYPSNLGPWDYVATLTGVELGTPVAVINPTSFTKTLAPGATGTDNLSIGNTGTYVLNYNASIANYSDAVSLTEGFEGGVVPPTGWTLVQNSVPVNPYTWSIATYAPHSGVYNMHCEYDDTYSGTQDEWLISPTFDFSSDLSAQMSFWWNMSYYWSVDPYDNCDLNIRVSTDGGATWSPTILWNEDAIGVFTSWTWYQAIVDLSLYTGPGFNNVKIAFQYYGYDGAEISVDDIEIISGNVPTGWLSLNNNPTISGSVQVGDPAASITVGYDATGLPVGTYHADIVVVTNEPGAKKTYTLPVTLNVTEGYKVSGNVYYGLLDTKPMATNTTVTLSPHGTTSTTTGGYYELTNVANGPYLLTGATTLAWGGMTTFDATLILRYAGGVPGFGLTDLQKRAADVNMTNTAGGVTTFDATLILRKATLPPGTFPPQWSAPLFVFDGPYPSTPALIGLPVTVSGANVTQNLRALCSGDVNGSRTFTAE